MTIDPQKHLLAHFVALGALLDPETRERWLAEARGICTGLQDVTAHPDRESATRLLNAYQKAFDLINRMIRYA